MRQKVEVSKVLYNDKVTNECMRRECNRIAELGGSFSIMQEFKSNWFTIYSITYPEELSNEDYCAKRT